MSRKALVLSFAALLVLPLVADGADVSGLLLYDGEPVTDVFTDIISATVTAVRWGPGAHIEGTVDLATFSYSIEGLEAARYQVTVYINRTDPVHFNLGDPGNLRGFVNIEPANPGDTLEADVDIRYNYHIISPIDSTSHLDGMGQNCNEHPVVPYPITFTIEPVPRATNYTFHAGLETCPNMFAGAIDIETREPTTVIEWGTAEEDFQNLYVLCTGASGRDLCAVPTIQYDDAFVWALLLSDGESTGRGIHQSNAVVIPAVAGTPGAHGTYWSSAVSITDLGSEPREIEVIYTPRGVDGLTTYSSETVTLPADSQLAWSDIVTELFGTTGAGAVEFRGRTLAVTSRTSTPGDVDGSYGQGIPPIQPEQLLSRDGSSSATMGGVEEGAVFRTNLGLCEVWGESATVSVVISDASMTELGRRTYELRPYENIQVNRVAHAIAGADSLSNGMVSVVITAGNGRVGAYLSAVDNATGDPTFITIARQSPTGGS